MITAETVNSIVRFQANGLPVVSLYCRVDPGASQREVRARVDSLLDQIRPLAKDRDLDHRYRLSVRADIERIRTPWAANAGRRGDRHLLLLRPWSLRGDTAAAPGA